MTGKSEKPDKKGDDGMEAVVQKNKAEPAHDLSLAWKNAPKLRGKPGMVLLKRDNPAHQELFRDEDEE